MTRTGLLAAAAFALGTPVGARSASADESTPAIARGPETEALASASTQSTGTGVALSYENGLWGGSAWAQGLRVRIPFNTRWGMAIRPMMMMQTPLRWTYAEGADAYRTDVGARVELYVASPIFLNFVRAYGGAGTHAFYAVAGVVGAKPTVGVGCQAGLELFLGSRASFFAEMGAASGLQGDWGAGATAMAGLTWYPWTTSQRAALVGLAK